MTICDQSRCPLGMNQACEPSQACEEEQFQRPVVQIIAGEYYVTTRNEVISTTVGSCIAACVRDRVLGIGGMNHFMLPERTPGTDDWPAARYGSEAMQLLIDGILKAGGRRSNLEVKLVGGGDIMGGMEDIGRHNIEFIHRYLAAEGLTPRTEDLGGRAPRKIYYFPGSGRVLVRRLRILSAYAEGAD